MDSTPEESGLDDSDSLIISEPPCSGAGSESSSSCSGKVGKIGVLYYILLLATRNMSMIA